MSTWTVFWEAAKETPKLYFAPIQAMLGATRDVQAQMLKTQGKTQGQDIRSCGQEVEAREVTRLS